MSQDQIKDNKLKNKSKYGEGKNRPRPVKMTHGLHEAINQYLNTEKAELMGFKFTSEVVNHAVRAYLEKQGFYDELDPST